MFSVDGARAIVVRSGQAEMAKKKETPKMHEKKTYFLSATTIAKGIGDGATARDVNEMLVRKGLQAKGKDKKSAYTPGPLAQPGDYQTYSSQDGAQWQVWSPEVAAMIKRELRPVRWADMEALLSRVDSLEARIDSLEERIKDLEQAP